MQQRGYGYWHWLSNTWLVVAADSTTPAEMYGLTQESYPSVFFLVNEVGNDRVNSWMGFGPNTEQRNMFEWLQQEWPKL